MTTTLTEAKKGQAWLRALAWEDRRKDLLPGLIAHLAANPLPDPLDHADTLAMLVALERRGLR